MRELSARMQGTSVAITGGAGFIGHHFHRWLRAAGVRHTLFDLRQPRWHHDGAEVVLGDVRDEAAVRQAIEGHEAVLHLAAAHHDFGIAPETFYSVNVEGARVLCRVMDELGIRRLCFLSSVAVYGSAQQRPDESSGCEPDSHYGKSKLQAERVLEEWAGQGEGRSLLVVRPTVTFGAWHFANMYTLIHQIARRRYVPVGDGRNYKSLVYVENLVDATMALWLSSDARPVRVINGVDKPDLTSAEITRAVYEALGRRFPGWSIPLPLALLLAKPFDWAISLTGADLPISGARIRKLAASTTVYSADGLEKEGLRARVGLREGLDRMVRWYLDEGRDLTPDRSLPPPQPLPFVQDR